MDNFLEEQIVQLGPVADRTVLFKKCYLACAARCGECRFCKRACPDKCTKGVDTGVGHVWRLSDRLPGFLVSECIEIFRNQRKLLTTADGFIYFKQTITKLVRRSYQDLFDEGDKEAWAAWEERLHENLNIEDYPQILIHFLAPLAQDGGLLQAGEVQPEKAPIPMRKAPSTRRRKPS